MTFFERLDEFRVTPENERGSIKGFCKRLGIAHATFLNWQRGATPELPVVERCAQALGTTPSYLLFGFGPKHAEDLEEWLVHELEETQRVANE